MMVGLCILCAKPILSLNIKICYSTKFVAAVQTVITSSSFPPDSVGGVIVFCCMLCDFTLSSDSEIKPVFFFRTIKNPIQLYRIFLKCLNIKSVQSPLLLWKPKIHNSPHTSPSLDPTLSHVTPFHAFTPHFSKTYSSFDLCPNFQSGFFPLGSQTKILCAARIFTVHITWPVHPSLHYFNTSCIFLTSMNAKQNDTLDSRSRMVQHVDTTQPLHATKWSPVVFLRAPFEVANRTGPCLNSAPSS